MKNFSFKIHPLFWLLGILLTLIGEGFLFLVYIFTAVIHEFAHSVTASYYKCRTQEIVLYPYGAVLYGEFSSLKPSEEAIVAISGPCFNLLVAVIFTALWWVAPEIYIYTDIVVSVNISIALFNLLPVYPLDGGRILMSLLKMRTSNKTAFLTVKVMGYICCAIFSGLYIISLFTRINYTFAVAAIFLFCSVNDKNSGVSSMEDVIYPPGEKTLFRGVQIMHMKVSENLKLFELLRLLNTQYYYIIYVTDGKGNTIKTIEHKNIENILLNNDVNIMLKEIRL